MSDTSLARRSPLRALAALALVIVVPLCAPSPPAIGAGLTDAREVTISSAPWQWPVAGQVRIVEPYREPEHDYGPGHRGIDLAAAVDQAVVAPADGTIAWVGIVADRALLTIDHGNSYVTTLEPVIATREVGAVVVGGERVGTVSTGGHTPVGAVHWGVRYRGDYVNPATLFTRAVKPMLLPCCDP